MKIKTNLLYIVVVITFILFACEIFPKQENIHVTGVVLDMDTLALTQGGTSQLAATISPADATDKVVDFSSSAPEIATVSPTGLLKAVTPGNAVITVRTQDGGLTDTCAVTVSAAVTVVARISISADTLELLPDASTSLTVTIQPSNATNQNITWISSNENIVSVSETGTVNATGIGDELITVTSQDGGFSASCMVSVRPLETGNGVHSARRLGSTGYEASPYGYYEYLPEGYGPENNEYPLLIVLHGHGESGDGDNNLHWVLNNSPPRLIEQHLWTPSFAMVVVSPQTAAIEQRERSWNADMLDDFISYILENYNINEKRVYLTGLSMGGYGTYAYIAANGEDSPVAAAIAVCGGGDPYYGGVGDNSENAAAFASAYATSFSAIPIWAFHNFNDYVVPVRRSVDMIKAINSANPKVHARLTVYDDSDSPDHDAWAKTYDNSGMNQLTLNTVNVYSEYDGSLDYSYNCDGFDINIYDWLWQYRK